LLSASYKNAPSIGMLFGIGILLGIGIHAQPLTATVRIAVRINNNANLYLFINCEDSSLDLYNFAVYKGFGKTFPGTD
jgi:hypothetical protein